MRFILAFLFGGWLLGAFGQRNRERDFWKEVSDRQRNEQRIALEKALNRNKDGV